MLQRIWSDEREAEGVGLGVRVNQSWRSVNLEKTAK